MKKLLICGLSGGYGGVSQVIMNVLRTVSKEYFDIFVVETYDSVYHDEIHALGFHTVKLPPFKKYFIYKKEVKKFFRKNTFDIVWINNTAKADLTIMRYAKKCGAEVIAHSHGSVQEGGKFKRFALEMLSKLNERKFYSYLDYGIACSQNSANYFYNEKFLRGKQIEVLPNAIDCEKFSFSENDRNFARKEFGVKDGDVVLACIGRICAVKNLGFAVKALSILPKVYKLIVIGSGDADVLMRQAVENGVAERLFLLGERNDINILLSGIDVLLMPSFSEGLPMTALEAQANGVKCILSDKISMECKALESTDFIGIDFVEKWRDAILNSNIARTKNAVDIMKSKKFDIFAYTERLMEIFNGNR